MDPIEDSLQACIQTFTIEKKDPLSGHAQCIFPLDFSGFQGHFPEIAVLPAIVQLAMVRHLAGKILEKKLTPVEYVKNRFRGMISPDTTVHFRFTITEKGDLYMCKFSIRGEEDETIADGNCKFKH